MGGLSHLVRRGGAWAGCGSAQSPPRCTKCNIRVHQRPVYQLHIIRRGTIITGRLARIAQPCRYCFYLVVQKWVFRPAGATRCPDKREIWHGGAARAKFHIYRGRNMGTQLPKLSKFRILAINLPLRGHSFAQFLRNSQILYASLGAF